MSKPAHLRDGGGGGKPRPNGPHRLVRDGDLIRKLLGGDAPKRLRHLLRTHLLHQPGVVLLFGLSHAQNGLESRVQHRQDLPTKQTATTEMLEGETARTVSMRYSGFSYVQLLAFS